MRMTLESMSYALLDAYDSHTQHRVDNIENFGGIFVQFHYIV